MQKSNHSLIGGHQYSTGVEMFLDIFTQLRLNKIFGTCVFDGSLLWSHKSHLSDPQILIVTSKNTKKNLEDKRGHIIM